MLLRSSKDPNYTVDWEKFAALDRTNLQDADVKYKADKVPTP